MSLSYPLLVTAHSEKWFHIWNLDKVRLNNFNPDTIIESPLKYFTSSICTFADGKGFAIGSIEGRCAIMKVNF